MSRIVVHHHLGLGDHFICNGLVNHLAESNEVVYLACKQASYRTVACLYREKPTITVFPVRDEFTDVAAFARRVGAPLLRVGFEHCDRSRFDESFYEQLGIPFIYRYSKFRLPAVIPDEDALRASAPSDRPFRVVHREASHGRYVLRIDSQMPAIDICGRRVGDGFDNLLAYRRLIEEATEIHCINSSVLHLVDSLDTPGRLFYHDVRPRCFHIRRPWTTVAYAVRPWHRLLAATRKRFE
jgi:hypothetical protein